MFGTHDLALFIVAGLLLNITPGPDMIYIASRTASQGLRAGVAAILGINAGCLVHTLAAAIGLSALLQTSAQAFTIIKLIGAVYLLYVGVTMLLERRSDSTDHASDGAAVLPLADSKRIFWQGFLTNVLNPKVALFFSGLPAAVHRCRQHAKAARLSVSGLSVYFQRNLRGARLCLDGFQSTRPCQSYIARRHLAEPRLWRAVCRCRYQSRLK